MTGLIPELLRRAIDQREQDEGRADRFFAALAPGDQPEPDPEGDPA